MLVNQKTVGFFAGYELLITIFMIGIVLTIGVPGFSKFTQNGRITSTANELHSSFHLGRSEAARSKSNVTICASANSMDAAESQPGTLMRLQRRNASAMRAERHTAMRLQFTHRRFMWSGPRRHRHFNY